MSLQFDAVDANAFDESSGAVEDHDALLLARVSTTNNRLGELFGVDGAGAKEGDWFEIKLDRARSRPRAWQLPFANGYASERPTNVVEMNPLAESSEIVGHLEGAWFVSSTYGIQRAVGSVLCGLSISNLLLADQAAINAGFDF